MRIGNGARDQVQLDVYGAVLEAIWVYAKAVGRLDGDTGKEVARIADYVAKHWRDKDNGIWEVRAERAHYIQSKGLCWVALDRACELGASGLIPNRSERWRAAADELKAWVDEHGWDDELQSLVRAPDLRELDASLLTLAVLGYGGERIESTIAAVERELREGPYVYRYRGDDGLAGDGGRLPDVLVLARRRLRPHRPARRRERADERAGRASPTTSASTRRRSTRGPATSSATSRRP